MFAAVDNNITALDTSLGAAVNSADAGVLPVIGAFSGVLVAVIGASIAVIVIRKMIKKAYSPAKRV